MAAAMPRAGSPFARLQELILPVCLVASVAVVLVPLPSPILDVLLASNIALSVIILLTTVYVRTPLEFSIFPSLLLATTLGRLVLNIATTRLVLTQAHAKGLMAAGGVVKSFGEFVAGDRVVVGLIIFAIIVVIQFVVITKGATRISEVAARFALDGLPGRQMAIDADLNAGVIDQHEAQRRRAALGEQADFFGAMDGASKFVRGDAIAGVFIILINIVGGLVIGVVEYRMDIGRAASLFTRLTIGDGLVSQLPAFLISVAAGLLVTRSNSPVSLPSQLISQLFSRSITLVVTAGFLALLVFTGLPTLPLLGIGGSCAWLAWLLTRRQQTDAAAQQQAASEAKPQAPRVEEYLAVEAMEVEIGVGLIRLADPQRGGDLLERIARVRQNVALEIGLIMPKVRVRDNLRLDQNQYRIKLADIPIAEGKIYPNMLLAVESSETVDKVGGLATREPASDTAAVWIEPHARGEAERLGYRVAEPVSVLTTHLTEVVRGHADEILGRDATRHLIEELRKSSPAVVEDLIPGQMKLVEVQQVLHCLLREQVSIRHLGLILEALGEFASRTKAPQELTEQVRRRLARAISGRYRDKENRLMVVTLDAGFEDRIASLMDRTDDSLAVRSSPSDVEAVCEAIGDEIEMLRLKGRPPIVLVSPHIRVGLKQLTAARLPRLIVLSYDEITRDTHVESVSVVGESLLAA
jgi:flagellar biosynthesis protein FlhA